jgi:hypothetical protein
MRLPSIAANQIPREKLLKLFPRGDSANGVAQLSRSDPKQTPQLNVLAVSFVREEGRRRLLWSLVGAAASGF